MKLVELGGLCFDVEDVAAFNATTEVDWDNLDEGKEWYSDPNLESREGCTTLWFKSQPEFAVVKVDYERVKVTLQIALRQTIGD
jgi:hypothetical protein